MQYVTALCDWCKHRTSLVVNHFPCCKAFPEGIEIFMKDLVLEERIKGCANGYSFELSDESFHGAAKGYPCPEDLKERYLQLTNK